MASGKGSKRGKQPAKRKRKPSKASSGKTRSAGSTSRPWKKSIKRSSAKAAPATSARGRGRGQRATIRLTGKVHPGAITAYQKRVKRESGKILSVKEVLRDERFKAAYRKLRKSRNKLQRYQALVRLGIQRTGYPLGETPTTSGGPGLPGGVN